MARDPVAEALRAHRARKRARAKGLRVPLVPPKRKGNPGHNPGPVGRPEAAWKERAAGELNRDQLRRALEAGNTAIVAARAEREAELADIRERCSLAREKLQAGCASRRTRSRTTAKARMAAAKQDKRDAHKIARAYRSNGQPRRRRRRIEAIQESDSAVEAEILGMTPELLPVWNKVKRQIKGTAHKSRAEAFFQYAEENAEDVQDILSEIPSDEEYADQYAAWAAAE